MQKSSKNTFHQSQEEMRCWSKILSQVLIRHCTDQSIWLKIKEFKEFSLHHHEDDEKYCTDLKCITYAGGHIIVETLWLVLQVVREEVVHHASHQRHLWLKIKLYCRKNWRWSNHFKTLEKISTSCTIPTFLELLEVLLDSKKQEKFTFIRNLSTKVQVRT